LKKKNSERHLLTIGEPHPHPQESHILYVPCCTYSSC